MESKGGGAQSRYTAEDAGMRHGAQRRAAEAGGWRVRVKYRWSALISSRVGG